MSLPSTRTRVASWPRAPTRSACWWKSAASEYGSSPEEQPALHTLIVGLARSHSAGTTFSAMALYVSQLRKSFVTLIVSASSSLSYSAWSLSRTRA